MQRMVKHLDYNFRDENREFLPCFADEGLLAEMDRPNMSGQLSFLYKASEMVTSDPSTEESLSASLGYFY